MGSVPQPPTPSSFSPFGASVTLLAAAPPGRERDGSTADSFPFDDNRDEKQKEGILEIIKISDVVSEKAARHDETCLAQVVDEEEFSEHSHLDLESSWYRAISLLRSTSRYAIARVEPSTRTRTGEGPTSSCAYWATAQFFSLHYQFETSRKMLRKRVEIRPTVRLAPFGSSSTNPGAVAESKVNLVLDSGASIHAVGDVRHLTDFVPFSIDMWAVCADGTRLRIVGTGTLQMVGFSIPKVRLVDGLMKNLISVSQLDKDHGLCCCFHSKKCEVILADGTVVGGAILQDDGMYEVYFLEVPPEPEE